MPSPPIPGQPHPDVAIVKDALRQIELGATISYDAVAQCIGLKPTNHVFRRRAHTARKQLRREGLNVVTVRGIGFLRQTADQTLAQHQGLERKGIRRKARKAGEALANVDIGALSEAKRPEFFAERTINNVVFQATSVSAAQKMLAAAKVSQAILPMAKALKILENGEKKAE